jgi:hypothetical protein
MGFWRNVGYVWGVLMILCGLALAPFGLISVLLGIGLILWLKHDAKSERMEKQLNKIAGLEADALDRALFKEWMEKKKSKF